MSDSNDLNRLGLNELHLNLTIAELSRAIVIAGGIVVYGGAINQGFTRIVLEEAEKYGGPAGAFEHYVPYTEHAQLTSAELASYAGSLGVKSTVYLLDTVGVPRPASGPQAVPSGDYEIDQATALTAMRTLTAKVTSARVIVGGRTAGFGGAIPGVAEEAVHTLQARKPLYIAGGFGGAATLVGSILVPDLFRWLPPDLPSGLVESVRDDVAAQLEETLPDDGLTSEERAVLAATQRPSDIATLAVLGLSRHVERSESG